MNDAQQMRRVRVDECGCWFWIGSVREIRPENESKALGAVRRRLYVRFVGPVTPSKVLTVGCQDARCVCPAHVLVQTKAALCKQANRSGALRQSAARIARITLAAQRRSANMNLEKAREVRARRAAGERGADLARELDISESMVHLIHVGRVWREPLTGLALIARQAGML